MPASIRWRSASERLSISDITGSVKENRGAGRTPAATPSAVAQVASPVMHDLVITGGVVHDGLGSPGAPADVAIEAGRVIAVGDDVGPGVADDPAEGRSVTPGSSTRMRTPTPCR